ncbi:aldose 1-epimerase family protein [Nonomuraea sp. NN258]|uniref:aldose 1-epimerase family protein n=1 Tax=Nonomuraea antri TaxID=2730852 RepID=UPI0015691135|nr:aldose 1-epimerase family protein [Nonomuraea antri]NRQ34672.1 aldose 1-epimerase family protein [Nonomuraea antri]
MPQLAGGGYTAQISPRGAALRTLKHGERDLITSWPEGGPVPFYAGTILAPWPNRVGDARYTFEGETHELEVTEPGRGHALHGLVAGVDWEVVEWLQTEDEHAFARLAHTIDHAKGYPFKLELEVLHRLDASGLTTTVTARNTGDADAPYGCAPHPWLLGDDLHLPAWEVLIPDERLLPNTLESVAGSPFDFTEPRSVAGVDVDHAFTALERGEARVGGVRISWDPRVLPWVQVCTGAQLGYEGVAVEPMTCPPDAFNSGTALVVLRPGEEHEASWTISAA